MSDFNYQAYLKNNPLLKEEVKDQLITESQEVEEVELPASTVSKTNAEVTNIKTMAQAMLDFFNQVKEKETVDFEANVNMKVVLDRLNTLAKTEEESEEIEETVEETVEESAPGYIGDESLEAMSKMGTAGMNLWHVVKLIDAGILQDSEKIKALKALDPAFKEIKEEVTEEEIQEEVTEETSSKMKVSELKAKIKEDIMSLLQEEEEDEVEVEDEIEDEVEVDVEEPSIDTSDAGLSQDEQDIQDSLKLAYDNAVAIGDQKLADQIGNSITFFTRTHVVER